ncbi:MAG: MYXO-CTERM sorting domain-containing protein [Deltaproteobacteria bacterium]|nr:MYXO-CTERM sorting domain-containing protein [Deltaproteobacteria bacterium]
MAALTRVALLALLLAAAPGLASAAPSDMSRDEILGLAASGVGYSYWWGDGCWRDDGTQHGSCSGSCPDCTHTGSYGADCSGFVAKVWQVPSPSPVATCSHPYSTQDFACAETWWTAISRDDLQRGDAAAYRSGGCPGSSGHVLLFERGDPWGSMWTYEARGCSTGIVHNSRTLTSEYRAIRRDRLVAGCTDADADGSCLPDDCDDGNPEVRPGAAEICANRIDDDCDGATDEDCGCTDADGDGFCPPDDCDDGDAEIHPDAPERCDNGADDDCDGATDEGCGCTDDDGDGFCPPDDCDDGNAETHPGAPERCGDGADDDCDGAADEDCGCIDADGDGYCPPDDCNDGDDAIRPGLAERCGNGVDDDCDGAIDEGCDCTDDDGDGYCPPDDCNDGNPAVHPGAERACEWGRDDDCDTRLDDQEPPCGDPVGDDGGCGCAPGAAATGPGLLAVLGLVLAPARRRRR